MYVFGFVVVSIHCVSVRSGLSRCVSDRIHSLVRFRCLRFVWMRFVYSVCVFNIFGAFWFVLVCLGSFRIAWFRFGLFLVCSVRFGLFRLSSWTVVFFWFVLGRFSLSPFASDRIGSFLCVCVSMCFGLLRIASVRFGAFQVHSVCFDAIQVGAGSTGPRDHGSTGP